MPTATRPFTRPLKRLSRPETPPPFRITPRDIEILRAVARFRFLSSEQIVRMLGASAQPILVRLKLLFYHAYLDRPDHQRAQLSAFFDEGNPPLVYGLGREGARLLAELGDSVSDKLDWTTKNGRATVHFLAHTLGIADAMLAFDAACAKRANVRLIDHHALLPLMPEATRASHDPFCCHASVKVKASRETLSIAVVPDRLFSLAYPETTRNNFALELDRGTMDIRAKTLKGKSSFRKKQLAYFHAWKAGEHTKAWGFQSFRILTITPSENRIENMIAAQHDVTEGSASGLFLYTTPERIAAHGALGAAWVSGSRERVALVS